MATPFEWINPEDIPRSGAAVRINDEYIMNPDGSAQYDPAYIEANDNKPLPIVNPADLVDRDIPEREWFLPGLIPMRQVSILSGDGGVGKSLLALQFAAASAARADVIGMTPKAGRALYIGAEDDADEFHRRLAAIAAADGRTLAEYNHLRVLPLVETDATLAVPNNKASCLSKTLLAHRLWAYVDHSDLTLIVLDTAADLFGGDEIKRNQVRRFVSMLRELAITADCAVILLAHPSVSGMQTGTGSSGSTAWNNSVRSRLYLTADTDDGDLRILKTMKANYGKTGDEIRLRWQDGAFVLDDGKPGAHVGLINKRAEKIFVEVLSKLNRQDQRLSPSPSATYAPKVIATQPEASGISKKDLVAAQQRLLDGGTIRIVTEGPPSRQSKRILVAAEMHGEVPSD